LAITLAILRGTWLQAQVYWFGNWWPRNGNVVFGIGFTIDAIGAALAVLTSLLATAALVFSLATEDTENHFQPLMLIFMGAMCAFSYTGDLFNLFVFFELMSVSAFALCALKTVEPAPLQGAYNFAIVNTVGAFMILIGIALLYARTGSLNLAEVGHSLGFHAADALVLLAFLLISVGYLVKAAIVPFHFWLADAHSVAPSAVCVLFSGVMVELGIYAVARVYWTVFQGPLGGHVRELREILLIVAAITGVIGGVMCYAEHHLKRLLAFSTISHAGIMLAGVGMLTSKALGGFVIYVLSHGLVKGGLFLCAGIVLHRLHKIGENHLHKRGRGMWFTATLFILGAWGLAGCPPFGTFFAESMILDAASDFGQTWLTYIFAFVEVITAAAVLRVAFRIFFGWGKPAPMDEASQIEERSEATSPKGRTPVVMLLPATVLILLGIGISAIPQLGSRVEADARLFMDQASYTATVLNNAQPPVSSKSPEHTLAWSLVRSGIVGGLALLLALGTVLRDRFGNALEFTRKMELGNSTLRRLQSGHPGDYVAWLTCGTALLGIVFAWTLR
jgi:multicomponent Na+:H+ antiporter subunit D